MLANRPSSPFQIIYEAAKSGEIDTIQTALKTTTIDVDSGATGAPVSLLAAEGEVNAVLLLQSQFGANARWVMYGYGYSKKSAEAEVILALKPVFMKNGLICFLILLWAWQEKVISILLITFLLVGHHENKNYFLLM
jgi:hypothetical protein